ncbi:hypothetical protein PS720_00075 [Pseudomonas fluorescens]|nr:hypothetical protein PS720_00075 [Pseudomonas fluorescens]
MRDQPCTGWRPVQQVGGGVVGEGFLLAVQAVLAGDDAAGGVVVQQLAVLRSGLLVEFAYQVAEFVVVVLQVARRTLLAKQLAEGVVGKAQGLGIALRIGEGDSRELVRRVVVVVGAAIVGGLGDEPANRITFQPMDARRRRKLGPAPLTEDWD